MATAGLPPKNPPDSNLHIIDSISLKFENLSNQTQKIVGRLHSLALVWPRGKTDGHYYVLMVLTQTIKKSHSQTFT
jgi:hypothetical protein